MKVNDELNKENRNDLEEKAKRELLRKYGNARLKSDNPYDILDMFNVEVNLPEIGKGFLFYIFLILIRSYKRWKRNYR
jgi:hypothetical protein